MFLARTSRSCERMNIRVTVSCFRPCATRGGSSSGEGFFENFTTSVGCASIGNRAR